MASKRFPYAKDEILRLRCASAQNDSLLIFNVTVLAIEVAGIVDEDGSKDVFLIVKDIETAIVLLDAPVVRVIQPQHGTDQDLVDHLMGCCEDRLVLVAGHDLMKSRHRPVAHLIQAFAPWELDQMGFL